MKMTACFVEDEETICRGVVGGGGGGGGVNRRKSWECVRMGKNQSSLRLASPDLPSSSMHAEWGCATHA